MPEITLYSVAGYARPPPTVSRTGNRLKYSFSPLGLPEQTFQERAFVEVKCIQTRISTLRGMGVGSGTLASDKVTAVGKNPCSTLFTGFVDEKHSAEYYAPILIHIPATTVTDNEAAQIARNLVSYDHGCAVGTICGLGGQTLSIAGHLGQTMGNNDVAGTVTLSACSGRRSRSSRTLGGETRPARLRHGHRDRVLAEAATVTDRLALSPLAGHGTQDHSMPGPLPDLSR